MDQPTSALGLALIVLAGATAGFLAASVPTASEEPDVGPIAPGQARSLDPAPEEIHVTATDDRSSHLLLFDEQARFQRAIHLDPGEESTVELGGDPVIAHVPDAGGSVELDLPASSSTTVNRTPTQAVPRSLAVQEGGTVDEELTLTIPNRPASLGLAIDGHAEGVHVSVRTVDGTVLRQTNETTEHGTPGDLRLEPGNLMNGTYRVSVHADRLDGSITLVSRTLTGAGQLDALSAPDERLESLGTLVARVQSGQAWQISTQDVDEMTLAIQQGATADVRLYGPEDRMLRSFELGDQGPDWRWGSNESQPIYDTVAIGVQEGTHTVYVDRIQADVDRVVYVSLPNDKAQPGRSIPVETRTVDLPYASTTGGTQEKTLRYTGGLVDIGVTGGQGPAVERRVTVDSPLGVVLDRRDQAAADGSHVLTDRIKHVESFGSGPLDAYVEAEAATGSVELALTHYVP